MGPEYPTASVTATSANGVAKISLLPWEREQRVSTLRQEQHRVPRS
jgi:hypothetical protein